MQTSIQQLLDNKKANTSFLYFVPALLWALLILVVCLVSPKYVPVIKFELLSPDKIAHMALFGFLCMLLLWGLIKNNMFTHKNMLMVVVACLFYGAFIELLQMLGRNGRSADVDDILANSLGILLAYLFYISFYRSLIRETEKTV